MFGDLVQVLERKGAFKNAIVVVLSDHGEALSLPSDSFFDDTFHVDGLGAPLKMLDYGHGQSVLSKSQYQVLLAFKALGGHSQFPNDGRTYKFPATVEDISPTLLDALKIDKTGLAGTGESLWPILATGVEADAAVTKRIRIHRNRPCRIPERRAVAWRRPEPPGRIRSSSKLNRFQGGYRSALRMPHWPSRTRSGRRSTRTGCWRRCPLARTPINTSISISGNTRVGC